MDVVAIPKSRRETIKQKIYKNLFFELQPDATDPPGKYIVQERVDCAHDKPHNNANYRHDYEDGNAPNRPKHPG